MQDWHFSDRGGRVLFGVLLELGLNLRNPVLGFFFVNLPRFPLALNLVKKSFKEGFHSLLLGAELGRKGGCRPGRGGGTGASHRVCFTVSPGGAALLERLALEGGRELEGFSGPDNGEGDPGARFIGTQDLAESLGVPDRFVINRNDQIPR